MGTVDALILCEGMLHPLLVCEGRTQNSAFCQPRQACEGEARRSKHAGCFRALKHCCVPPSG